MFFFQQVGLFRKSGVKSRIQALRQMNESAIDCVSYEGQSAYDVADMLKQYFRDLPEPLMTNKLSETFLQIYQCKCPLISTLLALGKSGTSRNLWLPFTPFFWTHTMTSWKYVSSISSFSPCLWNRFLYTRCIMQK